MRHQRPFLLTTSAVSQLRSARVPYAAGSRPSNVRRLVQPRSDLPDPQTFPASKRRAVERPTPERVIEAVAAASSVAPWMLFSPRRSPNLAKPRAAALYLLRQEAGLRAGDVARLTGRKRETVHRATRQVAVAVDHDEQLADPIRGAHRLLASP